MTLPDVEILIVGWMGLVDQESLEEEILYISSRSYAPRYKPLIKSISGIGLSVGQNGMPVKSTGTLVLDNSKDSFENGRKLGDLFERYTPIGKNLILFIEEGAENNGGFSYDTATRWDAKVSSISDMSNGTITLSLESISFENKKLSTVIPPYCYITITGTGGNLTRLLTVDRNIGRPLPLLFGDQVEVPCVPIFTPDDAFNIYGLPTEFSPYTAGNYFSVYAYAAAFGQNSAVYQSTGFGALTDVYNFQIYCKDDEGVYRSIDNGSSTYSATIENTTGANYITAAGMTERAFKLSEAVTGGTENGVLTGGAWRFKGQNSGGITPTGEIYISLYELSDFTTQARPSKLVATATIKKSDYLSNVRGASDFWAYFAWDKPIVMKSDGNNPPFAGYAISMRLSQYDTATTDFVDGGASAVTGKTYWTRTSNGEWSVTATQNNTGVYKLYTAVFKNEKLSATETTDYYNDYIVHGIKVSQETSLTPSTRPSLGDLDFIIKTTGMIDDADGTITGSAGSVIKRIDHVVKLITSEFNGTKYVVSSNWDFTDFSADYSSIYSTGGLSRYIEGATEGEITLESLLAQIMQETGSKILQRSEGIYSINPFTVWVWGANHSVVDITTMFKAVFTDEIISNVSFRRLDSSSIVNRVKINYKKSYLNYNITSAIQDGNASYYTNTLDAGTMTGGAYTALAGLSKQIYGEKFLDNLNFNFIGDSETARIMAEYFLRNFDHPQSVAKFNVPYWAIKNLELMDLVEVISAELPAYYGATYNASAPVYNGANVDLQNAEHQIRAVRYSGYVISKAFDYSEDGTFQVVLEVLLIKPFHQNNIL